MAWHGGLFGLFDVLLYVVAQLFKLGLYVDAYAEDGACVDETLGEEP